MLLLCWPMARLESRHMTPFCSLLFHTALNPGECTDHYRADTGHVRCPLHRLSSLALSLLHKTLKTRLMKLLDGDEEAEVLLMSLQDRKVSWVRQ